MGQNLPLSDCTVAGLGYCRPLKAFDALKRRRRGEEAFWVSPNLFHTEKLVRGHPFLSSRQNQSGTRARRFHLTVSESELKQSLIHLLRAAPRQQGAHAPAYMPTLPRELIHPKSGKPGGIFMPAKFSQHFDMNTFLGVTKIPGEPGKRPAAMGSTG